MRAIRAVLSAAAIGAASVVPVVAHAHPGHHAEGFASLTHLLTEPDHLAMIVGAGVVAVLLYRRVRRHRAPDRARRAKPADRE